MFADGKPGQSSTRQVLDIALWIWWLSIGMNVIGHLSGEGGGSSEPAGPSHYALVIDAGSTGNRIHVYKYTDDYPIPSFDFDSWEYKKFKPGLSSFEQTPNEAGGALEQLVDFAKEFVPKAQWKTTPIQLRATAGMRKVRAKNPSAAKQIMKSVRKYLEYNSPFEFEHEWASIIEGTAEGRYGWITANYLNGFFKRYHDDRNAASTGVLEMGGESVQLTFVPNKQQMYSVADGMLDEFSFAGEKYPLFVHSWMGYGFEAAQERQDQNYYERTNPCYLKGTVHTYTNHEEGEEKHDGSGSWPECYLQTKDLINEGACQEKKGVSSCALDGVSVPSMRSQDFYLIENFFYTAEFFGNEVIKAGNYRKAIERAGIRFCALDHETVVSIYPDQDEYHFSKECFGTAYIAAMLDIGFHIDPQDYGRFQVVREIQNIGIDWALGAVMDGIERTRGGRTGTARPGVRTSATASLIGYFFHVQWLLIATAVYLLVWIVHIYRFGRPGLPPYLQRMLAKPRANSEGGIELQGFLHNSGADDKNSNDGDPSRTL